MIGMPPKKIYDGLPPGLTFDTSTGLYRYKSRITNKFAWSKKDRSLAIDKAKKSNAITDFKLEQERVQAGKQGTLRYVIALWKELVLPHKPWKAGTIKNKLAKINRIDEELGLTLMFAIDEMFIADFLNKVGTSGDVYNKWREVWVDLCTFALSRKLVSYNAAERTLKRSTSELLDYNKRKRTDLILDHYNAIYYHKETPAFLKLAMSTTLKTLQSVSEVTGFELKKNFRNGHLFIIRKKTESTSDYAFIKVPLDDELLSLKEQSIEMQLKAGYRSLYFLHRKPARTTYSNKRVNQCGITENYLSKTFARIRNMTGLYDELGEDETPPTYHSIRGLGGKLMLDAGFSEEDVQLLMTHSDKKTTKIYTEKGIAALTDDDYRTVKTGQLPGGTK